MAADLGGTIKRAREAAGLKSNELAERVGLSASAMSLIESGARQLKAHEVVAIASVIGVSPLALLEPINDDQASYMLAARTTIDTSVDKSRLMARLNQVVDLRLALGSQYHHETSWRESVPPLRLANWLSDATQLADWANEQVGEIDEGPGRFAALAEKLGSALGIDVIVENFEDDVIGGAVLSRGFPTIVVNSSERRQRALFTLAHELGHILSSESGGITVDRDIRATSDSERAANAFASAFLMPKAAIDLIVAEGDRRVTRTIALMMARLDCSYIASVYRLHNLGYIVAAQRDGLLKVSRREFLETVDEDIRGTLVARSDKISEGVVLPAALIQVLVAAYERGDVSAAPLAAIMREPVEAVIERLKQDQEPESKILSDEVDLSGVVPDDSDLFTEIPA